MSPDQVVDEMVEAAEELLQEAQAGDVPMTKEQACISVLMATVAELASSVARLEAAIAHPMQEVAK